MCPTLSIHAEIEGDEYIIINKVLICGPVPMAFVYFPRETTFCSSVSKSVPIY